MKRSRQNVNKTRLSGILMRFLYEHVILRWEQDLSQHSGFNIRQKEFQFFRRNHEITLEALENAKDFAVRMETAPPSGNWFVFCDTQSAQPKSLFKHIRNAAAHGHIEKRGNQLFLQSYNTSKKETMRGEIALKLFEPFVEALVNTAMIKPPEESKV